MSLLPKLYVTTLPPFQEMIDEREVELAITIHHGRRKNLKQQIRILKELQKNNKYEMWTGIKLDNIIILQKEKQ